MLRELMGRVMPMVAFDPNEEPTDLPTQGPILRRFGFVPECRAVPDEFKQQLRRHIEGFIDGQGNCKAMQIFYQEVAEDRNPSEIAIISVAFFFSVRSTRVAHGLKRKYLERLQQKSERELRRAYFELHTESHRPGLPDLMKLTREEVLKERFASVLLATALGLMQVPEEDDQQIVFGWVDEFGQVKDRVESGMKMSAEVRETVAESETKLGHKIPTETIVLYFSYFNQFSETSLPLVEKLVLEKMAEDVDFDVLKNLLNAMRGHCFLLSGKKTEDGICKLVDEKLKEAAVLARRLSDGWTL
jgi:hypothetical protein